MNVPDGLIVEQFTACAMCPKCGAVDVHWIARPRVKPPGWDDTPLAEGLRRINESIRAMSTLSLMTFSSAEPIAEFCDAPEPASPFEPDDATVARICRNCEYRWGQA